ncbi:MAG: HAD family hydrolase [Actinomycetota bacterium]|nr:HAD family hydrolase [Actinomycetota bacterium]
MTDERLPSWRPGPVRDAIVDHLDRIDEIPVAERIAYFDNDGTLWCEKPEYVQLAFFVDVLVRRREQDPEIAERPELAALLGGDPEEIAGVGLVRIALALAGLFEGQTPEEFAAQIEEFVGRWKHPRFSRPVSGLVYQPMLELIDELRRHDVTVGIVTGGGTEFVRAVSEELYGVPAELVVGTLIGYEVGRNAADGPPVARRTASVLGEANEGPAKIANIQTQLGRRPVLAAGNSAGDREMLEWACAGSHPGLAILVDHDDAEREYAYQSKAATFAESASITDIGRREGWVVVSMARDWSTVFAD